MTEEVKLDLLIKSIDTLKTALGTMVLFPTETSDPNNIGKKIIGAPVQRPILEGENRKLTEDKLMKLISKL